MQSNRYSEIQETWQAVVAAARTRKSLGSNAKLVELVKKTQRKFEQGLPIFREAALFREASAAINERTPNADWFSELWANKEYIDHHRELMGTDPDQQSAILSWSSARLRSISDTSNWFKPTEGLTYKLLATDLKGAVVGDLQLPYPAFYVELPDKLFYLYHRDTGWHTARSMLIVKGTLSERTLEIAKNAGDPSTHLVEVGDRLLVEIYGEPNENSLSPFDDVWVYRTYPIFDPTVSIEDIAETRIEDLDNMERKLHRGRLGDREMDGIELRKLLFSFVLNLCVYLGSEKAEVHHLHGEEIKRLQGGKKFKLLRKNVQERIRSLQNDRIFTVGTNVKIDPEIREFVRTEGTGGFKLTYRTLVRGHYRNQAHGPGRALRTRKWIEPHVRGVDLPTKTVGHNYDVG